MKKTTIGIIGAGLGGLSAAARLAHAGFDVTVFEQQTSPGGKAHSLSVDGYRFDTGPSLVTMPFVIRGLFEDVGERMEDYLTLRPLDVLCDYYYTDGTRLRAYADPDRFAAEIEAATTGTEMQLRRYLDYCRRIYSLTAELFLFRSIHEWRSLFRLSAFATLLRLPAIDALRPMRAAVDSFFTDPKLRQLFSRYATYNGSDPFRAPATLNIIAHVEYSLGAMYCVGGMVSLPRAVARLAAAKGVRIVTGAAVERIVLDGRTVTGLTVDGAFVPFDRVLSNADVRRTYETLLGDTSTASSRRQKRLEPSSSALVFYWGLRRRTPFGIHSILFSREYEREFGQLFTGKQCPDDPTVYVYISSKFSADDAPEGCENLFVMINAPHDAGQDWDAEVRRMRPVILKRIREATGEDIEADIVAERTMTPKDIERSTGSSFGSIYGIASNTKFAAFLREPNRSRTYKGLYFCGGSAHPGGGIPLVMLSGKIAADLIQQHA